MQQLLQSLADGRVVLQEIPVPDPAPGAVLVRTSRSLISSGTERMLIEFGRANWLAKIRQQPEKVQQVLDKMLTDGILATLDAVRSKLGQPIPFGYCNVGRIVEVGAGVSGFSAGDRVVSNGSHAEFVAVGRNLCARIPDSVTDDEAAFIPLAAIALQGMRLAAPEMGERFCVIGLGLIGLIAVQLLRANGCKVLGADPDPAKSALARRFGADVVDLGAGEDLLRTAQAFSGGRGVDAVLITAATDSNEPVQQAAQMCRQRGRIVLTGVAGLELNRADFYRKEISFQVSCSYGPGRYDETYESRGFDYPFGLVRWTEQRNFEAVLQLMESASLDVRPLISHRFAFREAASAYDLLADRTQASLGIMLDYEGGAGAPAIMRSMPLRSPASAPRSGSPAVAFIGAGNYAGRVLIPAFRASGARLFAVVTANGINAARYGREYGFETASTDIDAVLASPELDLVVIATRHDSHAKFVQRALAAGKHVFVEKPLALADSEIDAIAALLRAPGQAPPRMLMIGFNRRFAPLAMRMKELLGAVREPKTFLVTVNAGAAPAGHWTLGSEGGGRIIGEACHFIDLLRFLAGGAVTGATARRTRGEGAGSADPSVCITLTFADGSLGTINYLTGGHASFPKERVEVFAGGRVLLLDNFRRLRAYGWPGFKSQRLWRQDKGQRACAAAFVRACMTGDVSPIPLDEILEVSRTTIEVSKAARH
ncbi:MAG TPA: bi-domain-containing oxidoreductase [Steroidobacteraceae bacterium]|nr:bi-domain-containing oxidoreductase [Steroidobacteraceae bacterium]